MFLLKTLLLCGKHSKITANTNSLYLANNRYFNNNPVLKKPPYLLIKDNRGRMLLGCPINERSKYESIGAND